MSRYHNQAQRVYNHVKTRLGFDEATMAAPPFNITVAGIEQKIEASVKASGLNGKKVADLLIKLWAENETRINNSAE